ncbi:MAG: phosphoribosylformylglycinamidine synthase subunit PurL [Chloroflexota bacterium]
MPETTTFSPAVFRLEVTSSLPMRSQAILAQLPTVGVARNVQLQVIDLYFLEGSLTPGDVAALAESLVCDPVTDRYTWRAVYPPHVDSRPEDSSGRTVLNSKDAEKVVEVTLRPGVTDNVAGELLRAARRLGIEKLTAVATGQRYVFQGDASPEDVQKIAHSLLVNHTIQRYALGEIQPEFIHSLTPVTQADAIDLLGRDEAGLVELSKERRLSLDATEMSAIQAYFRSIERQPTDAELETLAQTWSEHCVHKTFKALVELEDRKSATPRRQTIDSLINTYLRRATDEIAAPWVRSAFVDNAGVIAFDDEYDISFKVETHNHPSAIEPFGGANTGVGGVVRDVLGVSHRPIANTDVLCFGFADQKLEDLPAGVLHPTRIRAGVIAGVEDYGNKLGLPTVNGAIYYHDGYTANPLVYCGTVGIGPKDLRPNQARPGDRVIVIGGRTGRDGLRGATFSSLTMDAQTGEVAGASVQIGDPITEKGTIEVVERARDRRLYTAITDCGAGGLSSAVGEMGEKTGVRVDLSRVPLKYAGLAPWEIWLSEAQERMVLAVPPENVPALQAICDTYWVELSDIGAFTDTGRLHVTYGEQDIVHISEDFLHNGRPRLHLRAVIAETAKGETSRDKAPESTLSPADLLLALLSHPNLASKAHAIRVYDHEVRGATVVKPLVGVQSDGPSDAAVLKPLEVKGQQGFVLANGINPYLGEADAYAMAVSVVDEAVRNAVAVGADPGQIAILDNFCWGDPRRPEILGTLVQACEGCYDAARHYGTPFISGKDSLNNEYLGTDGQRHAIPGSLLISSIAIHPDVHQAVTMDLKAPGNFVYLVGEWTPALAGSHAALLAPGFFGDASALNDAPKMPASAPQVYRSLHAAMMQGLVCSAHDLSEGGLAVSAAEMCIAARMGLSLDVTPLHDDARLALFAETNGCLLVEVAPENAAAFEQALGPSLARKLGQVNEPAELLLVHKGLAVVRASVSALVNAFNTHF